MLLELFYCTHSSDAVMIVMSGIAALSIQRDSSLHLPAWGGTVLLAGGHCDVTAIWLGGRVGGGFGAAW